jgi:hypothetical protein
MEKERLNLLGKLVKGKELTLDEAKVLGSVSMADSCFPFRYVVRGDNRLGAWGYVFPVIFNLQNLAAKLNNYHFSSDFPKKEFEMHSLAYKLEVSTVRPEGLFNVYNVHDKSFWVAEVMERIHGKTFAELNCKSEGRSLYYLNCLNKKKDVIKKNAEKTFEIHDYQDRNVLFEPSTQKVYLIDLESWTPKQSSEVSH